MENHPLARLRPCHKYGRRKLTRHTFPLFLSLAPLVAYPTRHLNSLG